MAFSAKWQKWTILQSAYFTETALIIAKTHFGDRQYRK
jgi:hypothetical protein